jgi:hypothetical protein
MMQKTTTVASGDVSGGSHGSLLSDCCCGCYFCDCSFVENRYYSYNGSRKWSFQAAEEVEAVVSFHEQEQQQQRLLWQKSQMECYY